MKLALYSVSIEKVTDVNIAFKDADVNVLKAQKDNERFILVKADSKSKQVIDSLASDVTFIDFLSFDVLAGKFSVLSLEHKEIGKSDNETIIQPIVPIIEKVDEVENLISEDVDSITDMVRQSIETEIEEVLADVKCLLDDGIIQDFSKKQKSEIEPKLEEIRPLIQSFIADKDNQVNKIVLAVIDEKRDDIADLKDYDKVQASKDISDFLSEDKDYKKISSLMKEIQKIEEENEVLKDNPELALEKENFESMNLEFFNAVLGENEEVEDEMAKQKLQKPVFNEEGLEQINVTSIKEMAIEEERTQAEADETSEIQKIEEPQLTPKQEEIDPEKEELKRRLAELEAREKSGASEPVQDGDLGAIRKKRKNKKVLLIGLVTAGVLIGGTVGGILLTRSQQAKLSNNNTDKVEVASSNEDEETSSSSSMKSSQKSSKESVESGSIVKEDTIKSSTETKTSYKLTEEEYEDYKKRLDNVGSGIYINSDGTLGGELKFSNGESKRIAEFNRDGDLIMTDGTKYSIDTVRGFLKRVENGGGN